MASLTGVVDELRDAAWELDAVVSQSGLVGRFTSGYRSRSQQTRLYNSYLAGHSAFPVAAPGFSAHEYGEAFDYVVTPYEYQPDVGAYWVKMGGEWGGAGDLVHFELPGASARAIERGKAIDTEAIPCGGLLGLVGAHCTGLYHAEDIAVGFLTPFWKTIVIQALLNAGFPDSEITKIVNRPISELHKLYPWLPI